MVRSLSILLTLVLLVSLLTQVRTVNAQAHRQQPEMVVSILIRNDSGVRVGFSLKNKRGEWKDFHLGPKVDQPYKDVDEIWIATEGGSSVRYKLREESRYSIFWNERRGLWDVYEQILR